MAKFRVLIDRTDHNLIKALKPVTWIPESKYCCYCQPKNENLLHEECSYGLPCVMDFMFSLLFIIITIVPK